MTTDPTHRLEDALLVLILTPTIRAFLLENDPMALKQAEDALLHSDLDSESKASIRRALRAARA